MVRSTSQGEVQMWLSTHGYAGPAAAALWGLNGTQLLLLSQQALDDLIPGLGGGIYAALRNVYMAGVRLDIGQDTPCTAR